MGDAASPIQLHYEVLAGVDDLAPTLRCFSLVSPISGLT